MSDSFKTIQSVGAKKLLEEISAENIFRHSDVIESVGDDAAVIKIKLDEVSLLTSDTFVEGVDFDLTYTPFQHLGYKILSAAVSDIYAMNGKPVSALINLALPNRISVQMIKSIYEGIYAAGEKHKVEISGGDMKANHANLVITVTVMGKAQNDAVIYRRGAAEGDAICVSGDLGGALAGLRILMREKNYWEKHGDESIQPELDEYQYVVKRQLVPEARKDLIDAFSKHSVKPTSMIDLSKGLINEVNMLAEASGTGAYLYQAALPIAIETRHVADEMEEDVDRYALYGGEDLELLFTLPENEVETFAGHFTDFTVIGRMVEKSEGLKMQTAEGDIIDFDELS